MKSYEEEVLPESRKAVPEGTHGRPRGLKTTRVVAMLGLLALVFAALFAFGYRNYLNRQRVTEAAALSTTVVLPVVNVEKVRQAPSKAVLSLPGNTTPVTEAYIYARASGYVRRRNVDIGDRVRESQLLAEIEVPELDQQVQQARASLAQAEKQLEQAKADLADATAKMELARVTWDRYKVLVEHGAISQQDGDNQLALFRSTSAAVNSSEARIGSAEQNVQASRASLGRLVTLQDFEKVRAPFSGVITQRNFDVGALISGAGGSLGQTPGGPGALSGPSTGAQGGELFRIAQIDVLRVLINVPESDAPRVRAGESAVVTTQAFPKREFAGRITRTANAVDVSSRTMLVEVQANNPDRVLLPGMFVQVRLLLNREDPPLLIPGPSVLASAQGLRVAVLQDLTPEDSRRQSKPYPKEVKRIHLTEIQVGRDYGQEIEVVSGLQGWEYVVVNPGDEIEEGAIVHPVATLRNAEAGEQRPRSQSNRSTGSQATPESKKSPH